MKELNDKFIEVFDEMYWSIDHDYKCGIEWTLKKLVTLNSVVVRERKNNFWRG